MLNVGPTSARPRKRTRGILALIAGLAALGMATSLVATKWGPGLSPDSVKYVCAARNIVAGNGASVYSDEAELVPLPYHPPFYPTALAAFAWTGCDAVAAARGLAAALFAANIFLAGFLVFKLVGRGWLAVLASCAVLSSPAVVHVHLFAWTEPLAIFLGMAGMALLVSYARGRDGALLVAGSLAVGLAVITRYDAAALVAAGTAALILTGRIGGKRAARALAVLLALSALPVALWLAAKYVRVGTWDARPWAFHPVSWTHVKGGVVTALAYAVPPAMPALARAFVVAAACGVVVIVYLWLVKSRAGASGNAVRRPRPDYAAARKRLLSAAVLPAAYIASYVGVYLITITLLDACVQMSSRTLLPVFFAGLFLAALLVDHWWRYARHVSAARAIVVAVGVAWLAAQVVAVAPLAREAYRGGDVLEFNGERWRDSDLVAEVGRLTPGTTIYSNGPDVIYLYTGRRARLIPRAYVAASRLPNETYRYDVARMVQAFQDNAALAYFDSITWRWYLPTQEELVGVLPLEEASTKADGTIYTSRSAND